jgi:hypothetical protein
VLLLLLLPLCSRHLIVRLVFFGSSPRLSQKKIVFTLSHSLLSPKNSLKISITMARFYMTSAALLLALSTTATAFVPQATPSRSSFVGSALVVRSPIPSSSSTMLYMNLFDRFTRVAQSNINSLLQSLEDPEKIMEQAVEDMQVRFNLAA